MKVLFHTLFAGLLLAVLPCILFSSEKLRVMKTVRFEIYYPDGMEKYAVLAAASVEAAYIAVAEYTGHELTRVLPIYIYHEGIRNSLVKKTYYSFLKYSIDIRVREKNRTKEIMRQMTHVFQYDILFNDNSGKSMNRNSCALINENFLKDMAEYMASEKSEKEKNIFFYALENPPGAAGELLKDARDYGGLEKIPSQKAPIVFGFKETEDRTEESIFDFRESVFEPYKAYPTKNLFRSGFAVASDKVSSAWARNSFGDELESWVFTQRGGLVKEGDDFYPELEAVLDWRMFVPSLSAALYLKKGIFSAFDDAQPGAFSEYNYGARFAAAYPFTKKISVFAQTGAFLLHDTAFMEAGAGLRIDGAVPGTFFFTGNFPVSGEGAPWNKFEISFKPDFAVTEWLRTKLGLFYGKIFGKDAGFSYYAGGFNLRTPVLCEYSGSEIFLLNPEISFVFPRLKLPLPFPLLEAEYALFADIAYMRKNESVACAGAGLRFIFYPIVVFKLDFVRIIEKKASEKINFAVEFSL
ncbi:MAG: hypothetical protein FWG92_06465 [Leptospirales bacterium]|nr:hypothetical protein [Leptospirales bacterium]